MRFSDPSLSLRGGVIEFVHSSSITVRQVLANAPLMAHPASHYVYDTKPVGNDRIIEPKASPIRQALARMSRFTHQVAEYCARREATMRLVCVFRHVAFHIAILR